MLSQQRSLLRLILLPSAFSSSFRSAGWSTFLLFNARQRANARQAWASNSRDVTTKDDGVIALGDQWKDVSSVLVCGDGDLSYSACVAQQLSSPESNDVALTATVLEKEQVHNSGAFKQMGYHHTSACLNLSHRFVALIQGSI